MTNGDRQTIVALSSGRPPAAIAVVRTSGPAAFRLAETIAGSLPEPRRASLRTLRNPADGSTIDQGLIVTFPGPETATGEDIVEYQCHGGKAVVAALISTLISHDGVREAEPGEFTRRALDNGRLDLTQAEGLADLLEAETETQRRNAQARAQGAVTELLKGWRDTLLELSAEAELAIDYADEEDGAVAYDPSARISELVREIDGLLAAPPVERLRNGVRVVVAGPPNAGKSSLVNALAGQERAIVTPIAGTTRDRIEVPIALGDVPIILVDTAGLRDSDDDVERLGVALAKREAAEADLLLWLGTEAEMPDGAILISAKQDLGKEGRGLPLSVVTGKGLAELKRVILHHARSIIPDTSQLSLTQREAALVGAIRRELVAAANISDPILIAEHLRAARASVDQITGKAGIEAMLDVLFGRFCLGK